MTRKGLSLGIVVTALVLGLPATAQTIVDGDTIDLKGTIFRLHGIDAPELRQVCADGCARSQVHRTLAMAARS